MCHYLSQTGNQDVTILVFPGTHDMEAYHTLVGDQWWWDAFWRCNRKAPGFYETMIE